MARKLDNVVLTKAAALALRREFIGWQCRIRQLAAAQEQSEMFQRFMGVASDLLQGRTKLGRTPRLIAYDTDINIKRRLAGKSNIFRPIRMRCSRRLGHGAMAPSASERD